MKDSSTICTPSSLSLVKKMKCVFSLFKSRSSAVFLKAEKSWFSNLRLIGKPSCHLVMDPFSRSISGIYFLLIGRRIKLHTKRQDHHCSRENRCESHPPRPEAENRELATG